MDQVKAYLRILMKHHFWLLVGAAAIFGLVCWWMGANSLAADTKKNMGKVKDSWDALDRVVKGKPANQSFAEQVGKLNDDLKKVVMAEWQKCYDQQHKLFHWPDVVADIAKLKPSEPIDPDMRRRYKVLVFNKDPEKGGRALQRLYERADYKHFIEVATPAVAAPEADAAAARPMNPGDEAAPAATTPTETEEGLVIWDPAHRADLEQRYDMIHQRDPTTLNIRLAQEDLWVLEQLADVIRRSNEGATDVFAATVKRIDSLEVAQWAIAKSQSDRSKIMLAEAKEQSGGAGMGMGRGADATGEAGEPKGLSQEEIDKKLDDELMDGRYLNDQGQPLTMADSPPFAEFKLLFVRMKLVVDQRRISELLYNCITAPLPIELRLVRMDPPLVNPLGGGATMVASGQTPAAGGFGDEGFAKASAPIGGGMQMGMGRGGAMGGSSYRTDTSASGGGDATLEYGPFDVTVEICGVVQIYNAPDEEKLASGSATDAGKRLPGLPTNPVKLPTARGGGGSSTQPGGMRGGMGGFGGMNKAQ